MAEGAIYAGARFYAGYPITPSSEIAEECSKVMLKVGGVYMQMEDEIASIAAVIGASLTGAKAFTATSGPGFSLMQENLGLAVMGEVPCVVIDVQRCGPSTGLATKPAQSDIMQLRWGRHGAQIVIALCPPPVPPAWLRGRPTAATTSSTCRAPCTAPTGTATIAPPTPPGGWRSCTERSNSTGTRSS